MGLLRGRRYGRHPIPGRRWIATAAVVAALCLGGATGAAGDPLDDLMTRAPASVAAGALLFAFADYDAIDPLRDPAAPPSEAVRARLMPFFEAGALPAFEDVTAWAERVGFGFGDVGAALWTGAPPGGLLLLRGQPALTDRGGLSAALGTRGWTVKAVGDDTALWVRRTDGAHELTERDPLDPFDGGTGRSGRVAVLGEVLAFSPLMAPVLAAAAGQGPSLAAIEPLAGTVAALRDSRDGAVTILAALALRMDMAPPDPFMPVPDLSTLDLSPSNPALPEGTLPDLPAAPAAAAEEPAGPAPEALTEAPPEPVEVPAGPPVPSVVVLAEIRTVRGLHQCRIAAVYGTAAEAETALATAEAAADWAVLQPPPEAPEAAAEPAEEAPVPDGVWRVVAARGEQENCWSSWSGRLLRGEIPLLDPEGG